MFLSLHYVSPSVDVILLLDCNWRMHLYFLELSNSAGVGRLWFKGVVAYVRIARCRSSPPSMAFVRLFFYGLYKTFCLSIRLCICW